MKKTKTWVKRFVMPMIPLIIALLLVGEGWIWSMFGQKDFLLIHLTLAIIVGMGYPAAEICNKLEERFGRLEELLKERSPSTDGDLKRGEDTTGEGESQGK